MSVRARMVDFFQMDEHLLGMKIKKQLKENLSLLKGILEKTVSTPETFPITD